MKLRDKLKNNIDMEDYLFRNVLDLEFELAQARKLGDKQDIRNIEALLLGTKSELEHVKFMIFMQSDILDKENRQ